MSNSGNCCGNREGRTSNIVDEAQDMSSSAFRFLRVMALPKDNDLFIVGDVYQRIYRRPVVLKDCCINIKGRFRDLRLNYRTTAQIGEWALGMIEGAPQVEFEGGEGSLRGYRSLLKGEEPTIRSFSNIEEEMTFIANTLRTQLATYRPEDICLVARTNDPMGPPMLG